MNLNGFFIKGNLNAELHKPYICSYPSEWILKGFYFTRIKLKGVQRNFASQLKQRFYRKAKYNDKFLWHFLSCFYLSRFHAY